VVAAEAGFIVCGDNQRLRLGHFRGILLLKLAIFMRRLPTR
jgi:hypothetical protein